MVDSGHFNDMLKERGIKREWADRAVEFPDQTEEPGDGTKHFIKQIPEFGGRPLRVIVNVNTIPEKRVTAFFDRRVGRKL